MNKFDLAKKELQKICTHNPNQNCEQVFCILHEPEYLGEHDENSHACLACTLNGSVHKVHRFLSDNKSKKDLEYTFTIYILLLYLLVEKMHTIFKYVGISYEYVENNWKVLIEIRKWANFIKHPKGFLFAHHPKYHFEDESIPSGHLSLKKINYANFVEPLYKREDEAKFRQTIKEFANKMNLLVIIPCPARIAKELSLVCKEFCLKIKDNKHFQEILKADSVLEDYYTDELLNE